MSLETVLAALKAGVSEVTGVRASPDESSACNPVKRAGVAEVSIMTADNRTAPPATPSFRTGVSPEPASIEACTRETHVTPVQVNGESEATKANAGEMATTSPKSPVYYADRVPMEVGCSPAAIHAEIVAAYPDTLAMEPFEPHWVEPAARETAGDVPATARRRIKALAILDADPKLRLAIVVDDPDADPIVVMVARRGYTGEIEIPLAYYNAEALLELLDRHSMEPGEAQ